ncbi:MAG: hypothetical protein LC644_01710 [Pseudonocardia sp.]|nr:hypothetical protein [Pseudonocardia sp.]
MRASDEDAGRFGASRWLVWTLLALLIVAAFVVTKSSTRRAAELKTEAPAAATSATAAAVLNPADLHTAIPHAGSLRRPDLDPSYIPPGLTLLREFYPGEVTMPEVPDGQRTADLPPIHHRLYGAPRQRSQGAGSQPDTRALVINVVYGSITATSTASSGQPVKSEVRSLPATYFPPGSSVRAGDPNAGWARLVWREPAGVMVEIQGRSLTSDELLRVANALEVLP